MTRPAPPADPELEHLLVTIRDSRGVDLTDYKRASLRRRLQRRIDALRLPGFSAYEAYLGAVPDEYRLLLETVFINVTSFFRDPELWDVVRHDVVPQILAGKDDGDPVRVWSAGCATGQEALSVAMVLAEAVGVDGLRRVKIYATDIDEDALARGRAATYPARQVVDHVPPDLVERWFTEVEGGLAVRPELRRTVVFGRHDLVQDPPMSRIDLLLCRNTLMYMNPVSQQRILDDFAFSLGGRGFLVLGRSEALASRTGAFAAVDQKRRIFSAVAGARRRPVRRRPAVAAVEERVGDVEEHIKAVAYEAAVVAQILVDPQGRVAGVNKPARELLGVATTDVGQRFQDLEVSYRPLELRSRIEQAQAEDRTVAVLSVELDRDGQQRWLDVHVTPLVDASGGVAGTSITFTDVSRSHAAGDELSASRHELETAYEELQSAVEELETTNEELQSTNEELETTNEELQSTNEELETMNEELQSTNLELETINDELRIRTDELDEANLFLETVLGSLRSAVIVLDREMRVRIWNAQTQELWGLRSDEVRGEHLMNLDIGFPVDKLHQPLRATLQNGERDEVTVDAVDRRGRPVRCCVTITPLKRGDGEVSGATVVIDVVPDGG